MNVGISVADLRVVLTMIFGSLSLNFVATGWVNFMGIYVGLVGSEIENIFMVDNSMFWVRMAEWIRKLYCS
jgi:hypothetical protein